MKATLLTLGVLGTIGLTACAPSQVDAFDTLLTATQLALGAACVVDAECTLPPNFGGTVTPRPSSPPPSRSVSPGTPPPAPPPSVPTWTPDPPRPSAEASKPTALNCTRWDASNSRIHNTCARPLLISYCLITSGRNHFFECGRNGSYYQGADYPVEPGRWAYVPFVEGRASGDRSTSFSIRFAACYYPDLVREEGNNTFSCR